MVKFIFFIFLIILILAQNLLCLELYLHGGVRDRINSPQIKFLRLHLKVSYIYIHFWRNLWLYFFRNCFGHLLYVILLVKLCSKINFRSSFSTVFCIYHWSYNSAPLVIFGRLEGLIHIIGFFLTVYHALLCITHNYRSHITSSNLNRTLRKLRLIIHSFMEFSL